MGQCTAKSKRSGERCKGPAIPGATVCHTHGGGAPQVKQAAALRLAALVDPAIDVLDKCMKRVDARPEIAERAARAVLNRTGYGATSKQELKGGLEVITDGSGLRDAIMDALKDHPDARIAVARRLLEIGQAFDKANESVQ